MRYRYRFTASTCTRRGVWGTELAPGGMGPPSGPVGPLAPRGLKRRRRRDRPARAIPPPEVSEAPPLEAMDREEAVGTSGDCHSRLPPSAADKWASTADAAVPAVAVGTPMAGWLPSHQFSVHPDSSPNMRARAEVGAKCTTALRTSLIHTSSNSAGVTSRGSSGTRPRRRDGDVLPEALSRPTLPKPPSPPSSPSSGRVDVPPRRRRRSRARSRARASCTSMSPSRTTTNRPPITTDTCRTELAMYLR